MPYPPRSKCLPVPVMSQANPKRGWNSFQEEAVRVRLPVLPTSCVMVCAPGSLVGKLGFIMTWRRSQIPLLLVVKVFPSCDCRKSALASQRRPRLRVKRGETFQSSWKYRPSELHGGCAVEPLPPLNEIELSAPGVCRPCGYSPPLSPLPVHAPAAIQAGLSQNVIK